MSTGLDAFKKRTPSKFASFPQPGATVAGIITEISEQRQATKYNRDRNAPKELDFWPSGDPKMEVWVTLQTNERDPQDPEDTGLRTIVVTVNQKKGGQLAAIMDACEAVGAETPLPGGFLALSFTHFDPESENQQNPRKLFAGQYQVPAPGGGAFTPQAQPVQQQAPQEQYNQWNPAPPAPVQQQAPIQQYQQAPAPVPVQHQAAPPAWAQAPTQPPAPQQYQPPVQVNTATGELPAPPAPVQQQAPAPQYQQPAPTQQAPQQGGGVDAVAIQALIAQGFDDATICQTTGAPAPAVAAIRAISPQ